MAARIDTSPVVRAKPYRTVPTSGPLLDWLPLSSFNSRGKRDPLRREMMHLAHGKRPQSRSNTPEG
jgi:hypothetical protein